MTLYDFPIETDWDRVFDDWAESITLRLQSSSLEIGTQQLTRAFTDHAVDAIVSPLESRLMKGTSNHAATETLHLILRTDSLPDPAPDRTSRVLRNGDEYRITSIDVSSCGHVWQVSVER